MFWLWSIFGEGVDIRLVGSLLRSLLALKIAVIMQVVPTGKVLNGKCLIEQYLLNRAWCQLHNLPVGSQKEYTFFVRFLFPAKQAGTAVCWRK